MTAGRPERAGTFVVRAGRVVYASDGAAALAGRGVGDIVGRPFADFVVPEQRPVVLERHARRLRGEAIPAEYDVTIALPGGGTRVVEASIEQDGADFLVHLRDAAVREVRRLRLDAVATLGAAIQRELAEDAIHARVRDGLWELGLASTLVRREPEGVRVVWARLPPAVSDAILALGGQPPGGFSAPWTEFWRRVWSEGAQFADDWPREVSRGGPQEIGARMEAVVRAAGASRAAAARLGDGADADLAVHVAGDWLRPEDVPTLRLFAAQLAAALEAARTVADLSRRNAELAALNQVAGVAREVPDLPTFLALASEVMRGAAGCAGTAVFVLDEAARELVLTHVDGTPSPPDVVEPFRRVGPTGPLWPALRGGGPVVVDAEGREFPELRPLGFRTLAWIPLFARSRAVGVLAAGFHAPPADVRSRLDFLVAAGAHVASAVESHRLVGDLRGRVEELSLLNEMGRTVAASLDLDRVLKDGAEAARRLVAASRGFVLLYEAGRSEFRIGGAAGAPDGTVGFAFPAGTVPIAVSSMEAGRPAAMADVRSPSTDRFAERARPGRSAALAPMLLHGEALGVVVVDEVERSREFTPSELERLSAVANQLAVAIGNARLYEETRRRAQEVRLIHEVGRALAETLDLDRVLHAGVGNLARIVDAPVAYLAVAGADGSSLELRAAAGDHPELVGLRLPLDRPARNLMAAAYLDREPIVIEEGAADPRVDPELRALIGGHGYLALPLVVRDRAIGAVLIAETRGPRLFTIAEVERAAAIANQLAAAADNARLYEDLRRSYGDLERAQRQLIQRERLAALGEMSAVVAHEVRNPLGVIFNSLGSLRRLLRPAGDAKLLLDILGEEADRLNRIVGDLLDFARPSTPDLHPEPLDRIVEDAVAAALAQPPAGVVVERQLDPSLPPVPMDPRLVRQAVLNVVVNAVQAMPEGGRVTVRTRREAGEAVVEIEDTGPGIPEEVRARIFEPFFTTKASGTGLGLAVVRRIVEGHGGTVAVRSRPGDGTLFALRFPLARAPVEKRPAMG